jgi:hypothetical protein
MKEVDITEWGLIHTHVFVREVTVAEWDYLMLKIIDFSSGKPKIDLAKLRVRIAILACCDESGLPLFSPGDETWIRNKTNQPMERILSAFYEINGLNECESLSQFESSDSN